MADNTGKNLEQKLQLMGVPQGVINDLRDEFFKFEDDEDERAFTYLPELEYRLAKAVLADLPEDKPLFMILPVAPPHGPTQLDYTQFRSLACNGAETITCDGGQDDYARDEDPYEGRAFGEGYDLLEQEIIWDEVSDKPTWMQCNPEVFVKLFDCKACLLNCFRGHNNANDECGTVDCSDDGPTCNREDEEQLNCRGMQQVFKDELASLHIMDCFIGDLVTNQAPANTVFFYTADHGTAWGEHGEFQKGVPYEEIIRVPFAVADNDA